MTAMSDTSQMSPLSEESSSGRKLCPDPHVGVDGGSIHGCRFPFWRHHRGSSLPMMAWSLPVKTQASVNWSERDGIYVVSLLWASPWRVSYGSCVRLLLRRGQWTLGQGPRMVVVRRGGGFGIHGGQLLHEAEQLLVWLG
jgi:hypothetical protein